MRGGGKIDDKLTRLDINIENISLASELESTVTAFFYLKKSRIRETSNLSTDADRRTDTILERLRDLSPPPKKKMRTADGSAQMVVRRW